MSERTGGHGGTWRHLIRLGCDTQYTPEPTWHRIADSSGPGDLRADLEGCAAGMATLLAAPAFLLFVLAPEWVLGIVGPGFASGVGTLTILALGQFVNVATEPWVTS